jgi:hypothetical protein
MLQLYSTTCLQPATIQILPGGAPVSTHTHTHTHIRAHTQTNTLKTCVGATQTHTRTHPDTYSPGASVLHTHYAHLYIHTHKMRGAHRCVGVGVCT